MYSRSCKPSWVTETEQAGETLEKSGKCENVVDSVIAVCGCDCLLLPYVPKNQTGHIAAIIKEELHERVMNR